MDTLNEGLGKN